MFWIYAHTELLEATAIIKKWTFIIKQEDPWTKYKINRIDLGEYSIVYNITYI